MLFSDAVQLTKKTQLKILPPTPDTGWKSFSRDFPRIDDAQLITLDLECKELDFSRGPGWGRGKVEIVGVALGLYDGRQVKAHYFPIAHEVDREMNLPANSVLGYIDHVLTRARIIVGANLLYDLGTLAAVGITTQAKLYDCQFAEALLDEDALVRLDILAQKYCGQTKETNQLYTWLRQAYGEEKYDQRENVYRASPKLVGPYAEQDAALPLQILMRQWPLLESQGLLPVFDMECRLIPLLIDMKLAGVTVDIDKTECLYKELALEQEKKNHEIKEHVGFYVDCNKARHIGRAFDVLGISYNLTPTGQPSITAGFLKTVEHPVANIIKDVRQIDKLRSTFLNNYILEGNVKGKLHGQFHPLKIEEHGTAHGRFSSSDPNLQNIPSRSALGKRVRGIFTPDYGHHSWEKGDYSQIEYRYLVHYAVGPGSDIARSHYHFDASTDYHRLTQLLVRQAAGISIPRNAEEAAKDGGRLGTLTIKEINFGLVYGMMEGKLGRTANLSRKLTKKLFDAYHAGNPYVKATMEATDAEAQELGYITSILGRRSRFNLWEPDQFVRKEQRSPALPYSLALNNYGSNIRRAGTYKALNYRLQPSAADQIKMGMILCYEAGIFNYTGVPRLTVHDELDFSVIDDSPARQEAHSEMQRIMETAIPLRIPVVFDRSRGSSWGDC